MPQGSAGMTQLRLAIAAGAALVLIGIVALIYHAGSSAGGDKVTVRTEKAHTVAVAASRSDERAAAASSAAIAASTSRQAAAIDDYVLSSIQEMRDALDRLPPAAAGAPLPAAPVDSLRAQLNAGITRANRAAGAAAAQPGADEARDAAPAQR